MTLYILLALIVVPLAEIAVFIEIGGLIGLWPTLVIVVATAVAGTALLRHQGLNTLARAQVSLAENRMPVAEVFDALCLLVGGALLLTPGFITDALGGLLLIPAIRWSIGAWVWRRMVRSGEVWVDGRRVEPGEDGDAGPGAASDGRGPTLEGEYEVLDEDEDEGESRTEGPSERSRWGRRR